MTMITRPAAVFYSLTLDLTLIQMMVPIQARWFGGEVIRKDAVMAQRNSCFQLCFAMGRAENFQAATRLISGPIMKMEELRFEEIATRIKESIHQIFVKGRNSISV